jgi:hypothetical protein
VGLSMEVGGVFVGEFVMGEVVIEL